MTGIIVIADFDIETFFHMFGILPRSSSCWSAETARQTETSFRPHKPDRA